MSGKIKYLEIDEDVNVFVVGDLHAINPMQTLYAVDNMRNWLDLWMESLGERV